MFIIHKSQKDRVNLSRCTNYCAYDFKPLASSLKHLKEDYRIVFTFSDHSEQRDDCVIWIFSSSEERDAALKMIDKAFSTILMG